MEIPELMRLWGTFVPLGDCTSKTIDGGEIIDRAILKPVLFSSDFIVVYRD